MITIDTVCRLVGDLEPVEIEHWIHERWVLPESGGAGWVFHEVDVARIRLIKEMKRDLAIDEEAMPVVLRLLDQVYALRRRLRELGAALDALPPEARQVIIAHLDKATESLRRARQKSCRALECRGMIIGLLFHILAAVVWVGGMFFAHFLLRPAAAVLDPPTRIALWHRVLGRFFPVVWLCIALLLASGYGMIVAGVRGLHVDVMQGIGIIMILAFAHLYFSPWKRFQRAVAENDFPAAAVQLNQIRQIVTLNLVLGLIVVVVGATGRYWE